MRNTQGLFREYFGEYLGNTKGNTHGILGGILRNTQRIFREYFGEYRIVASTNTCYYSENQLFVQRSQYIHTGLIDSRSIQNYAFKEWLSLETIKLWLLVLTKTLFLMALIIKLTFGNIFIKCEKSTRRRKIIKTSLKTLVSPLLTHPQGSQGCQKICQDPLNMPVEIWCAKIAPKLKNI